MVPAGRTASSAPCKPGDNSSDLCSKLRPGTVYGELASAALATRAPEGQRHNPRRVHAGVPSGTRGGAIVRLVSPDGAADLSQSESRKYPDDLGRLQAGRAHIIQLWNDHRMTGGISFSRGDLFPAPTPAPTQPATDETLPPRGSMELDSMGCSFSPIPLFEGSHPGWTGRPPAEGTAGYGGFPDTANTSSTENLFWGFGADPVRYAEFIVVWQPQTAAHKVKLVYMPTNVEDGYGTWHEICHIDGAPDANGWGPRSFRFDCTRVMQAAQAARKDWYVGVQVYGDGVAPVTLWKSRLYLVWER